MLIFITLLILLFVLGIVYYHLNSKFSDFYYSPLSIFIVFYSLVYFVVPLVQILDDKYNRFSYLNELNQYQESLLFTIMFVFLYFFMVILGFSVSNVKTIANKRINEIFLYNTIKFEKKLLLFLILILGVVYTLLIVVLFPIMSVDYQMFMVNRISLLAGMGYITAPVLISVTISILIVLFVVKGKTKFQKGNSQIWMFIILLLIISFFVNIALGSRLGALINIIYFVFTYIVFNDRKKKPIWKYFVFAISVIYVVSILGNLRELAKRNNMNAYNIENILFDKEIADEIIEEVSNSFSHFQFLVFLNENRDWNFAYGKTYMAALLMPVPRAFWHNKPVGGGPYLKNIVKPGSYVVYEDNNSSYTTGAPLEAYLNFGILGILFIGFLHGTLIGKLTNWSYNIKYVYQIVVYIILLFMLGEMSVYGEFAGVLVRAGTMIVPIYVFRKLYLLFSK